MEKEELSINPAQIERRVEQLRAIADPAVRQCAEELVASVLDLHAAALGRMLQKLRETHGDESAILAAFDRDEIVRSVLLLHDLHPYPIRERVDRTLEQLRTRMERHGATAEILQADQQEVKVRLKSGSSSCGSNGDGMRLEVQNALMNAAPDSAQITVILEGAASDFVPLKSIQLMPAAGVEAKP